MHKSSHYQCCTHPDAALRIRITNLAPAVEERRTRKTSGSMWLLANCDSTPPPPSRRYRSHGRWSPLAVPPMGATQQLELVPNHPSELKLKAARRRRGWNESLLSGGVGAFARATGRWSTPPRLATSSQPWPSRSACTRCVHGAGGEGGVGQGEAHQLQAARAVSLRDVRPPPGAARAKP